MPPVTYSSITALEDNTTETYMGCTEVLIRIARNILRDPNNPKYRSISLGSNVVTNKLLPASGAMQCLFDMGFQEGSDKLVLPSGSSLDCVRHIHDELLKRRDMRKCSVSTPVTEKKSFENQILMRIIREITVLMLSIDNRFLKGFIENIYEVWKCESVHVQLKALKCIPLTELKSNVEKGIRQIQLAVKKKELEDQVIDYQELLLMQLCKWFKSDFFQWVNIPECTKCGNKEAKFKEEKPSSTDGISRTEVYECPLCKEIILFPRYRNAEQLLVTRRGRCGEWAKCFYLLCRSIGWDSRFIVDEADHAWVEIYSTIKKRWIHCDPCESAIDLPLMYECGWKKNLSYIMAYSKDEIQDVTWRYSCKHSKVLKNRKGCSEKQLVEIIHGIREILLSYQSGRRRDFVIKRTALELVELLQQKTPTESEKKGRVSGSLAWKLARGEFTPCEDFVPRIWKHGSKNEKFSLSYCTSTDEYIVDGAEETVKGWRNGLYKIDSVFRKEESDWKMVYLAREEGSEMGTLAWRFETEDNFAISDVHLSLTTQTYESGRIVCRLSNDVISVDIPNDATSFSTGNFSGSRHLEISVQVSGGRGENAWQHAQLLRQSMNDRKKTFHLVIGLVQL